MEKEFLPRKPSISNRRKPGKSLQKLISNCRRRGQSLLKLHWYCIICNKNCLNRHEYRSHCRSVEHRYVEMEERENPDSFTRRFLRRSDPGPDDAEFWTAHPAILQAELDSLKF